MAVALLDCVCCTIKCAFWVKFCMQEEIHFEPDWGFKSHLVRKKCTPKRERATGTAERNAAGKSLGLRHTLLTLVFFLLVF